jgi:RimJ/RimL family protein N-acetyltransferase
MRLRPATALDFPFIRSLAQRPDYAPFITDEDEAGLSAYLADPDALLQIWGDDGANAGFALWCGLEHPAGVVELRRLALSKAGAGQGLGFLHELTRFGFEDLCAQKVWLDASGENQRAAKVYAKAGYTLEGTQRAHWWRPALGRTVDVLLFGMMREDWQP